MSAPVVRVGLIGTVHRMESRFERWRPDPKPCWRERAAPEAAGGVLYDLGSHLIDQARVLFGEVTHVYAQLDRRSPGNEVDNDTFVSLAPPVDADDAVEVVRIIETARRAAAESRVIRHGHAI